MARGVLAGARWRRRRYHLVAFDGCVALVPAKRGRDAASLLRYSSGQLGTLDGGSRIVRDVEVVDGTVHQDIVSGGAVLDLARGDKIAVGWWGWPNRHVDAETLLADAFPRKIEQTKVQWTRRVVKAALGAVAAVAIVAGLVVGVQAVLSRRGAPAVKAAPVTTLPPNEQAARQELAAACQPWAAATANLGRGDRPDPGTLRPVVNGMRPHFDAAAGAVARYSVARDQLAFLQEYAAKDALSAFRESSARIEFARDTIDSACSSAR